MLVVTAGRRNEGTPLISTILALEMEFLSNCLCDRQTHGEELVSAVGVAVFSALVAPTTVRITVTGVVVV